jgi:thioesterase domain-containing protein
VAAAPAGAPSPGAGPAPDPTESRRDRLAERRVRLGAAQRAALEERLRSGAVTAVSMPAGETAGGAASAGPRCLVPLRPGGDGPPLFLVHPAGGDVLCFQALATHLAPGRPVYGLQSWGLIDGAEPDATIEAMAERYVEEVRRVQREGPCHLAGWSLGGGLAFEMARRLESAGAPAGLLAVIDTVPRLADLGLPELDPGAAPDDARWLMHVVEYAEGLSGRSLGLGYEALRALPAAAQVGRVAGALTGAGLLPAGAGARYLERLLAVFKTNCRAAGAYRPGRYGGSVVLFRAARDAPGQEAEPDLGWGRYAGRPVAVEAVPGTHVTLLAEPHVRELAARLDDWLTRLERAPRAITVEAS